MIAERHRYPALVHIEPGEDFKLARNNSKGPTFSIQVSKRKRRPRLSAQQAITIIADSAVIVAVLRQTTVVSPKKQRLSTAT